MCPDPPMTTMDSERGGEGKQYVPRDPVLESDVAGANEDHAVGNRRSPRADRTTLGWHSVHGFEFLCGIEFPDRVAIGGGNRAKHPVHATREENAGNHA